MWCSLSPKDTSLIRTHFWGRRGVPIRGGLLYSHCFKAILIKRPLTEKWTFCLPSSWSCKVNLFQITVPYSGFQTLYITCIKVTYSPISCAGGLKLEVTLDIRIGIIKSLTFLWQLFVRHIYHKYTCILYIYTINIQWNLGIRDTQGTVKRCPLILRWSYFWGPSLCTE